jgi:hypothetical protein
MTVTAKIDDEDAFAKLSWLETQQWIAQALKRPSDFGYRGDNGQMFQTWSLGPVIQHRDSDLLEKSNAKSIIKTLESDPSLEGDWELVSCSHWGVGWVEHLSFRVIDEDEKPSRVARVIKGLFDAMEEYPILDDEDHSRMEYEATLENIQEHYRRGGLKDDAPDDWASQMFSWFWDNDQSAVENCDGQGGYPDDAQFEKCARDLGFWDTSEDEDEGG